MTDAASDRGAPQAFDMATAVQLLHTGKIEVRGAIPWSSNYALLVTVRGAEGELTAIYKPRRGERPLWDFPPGSLYLPRIRRLSDLGSAELGPGAAHRLA